MRHTLQWHLFEGKENSNENKQTTENLDFKRYNNQYGKLILYYFTDSRQLGQKEEIKYSQLVDKIQYTYTTICKVYCIYSHDLSFYFQNIFL